VDNVNAVEHFARQAPSDAVRRLAALRVVRFDRERVGEGVRGLDRDAARVRVCERWGDDLCGFLNALTRGELCALAESLGMPVSATVRAPELRERLWQRGAELERGGARDIGPALQPRPVLLGGHPVVQAPPPGLYPPSVRYPRPVPGPA